MYNEKEFLELYKEKYKSIAVSDSKLLAALWDEWDYNSKDIEIGPFESASGRPELIPVPEEWFERAEIERADFEAECERAESELELG